MPPRKSSGLPTLAWSFGGGVQSSAIAALVASGRLALPDLIIMADTGREASDVWTYLNETIQPLLATVGRRVEIAAHSLSKVDLYSSSGMLLIPAFTGSGGRLRTYCSVEWKRRVVRRWLRRRGVKRCDLWIGITTDEAHRAKDADVKWITHRWPLLDLGMNRADCVRIVSEAGLPPAPRSSCWMCPFRGAEEWAALSDSDFAAAQKLDCEIRKHDPNVFLLRPGVPLTREAASGKGGTDGCEGGYCWT